MSLTLKIVLALIIATIVSASEIIFEGKLQFSRKVSPFERSNAKIGASYPVECAPDEYCKDGYYCCNLDGVWVCCEDGHTCTVPKLGTCSPSTTTEGYGTSYFDACIYQPCENGGTCFPFGNPYTCLCPPNYYGMNCTYYEEPSSIQPGSTTEAVSPCHSDTCQNGGTCIVYGGLQYRCYCAPDYSGTNCQYYDGQSTTEVVISTEPASPCHSDTCQNGGTCTVYGGLQYRCHCAPDYYGTNCQYYQDESTTDFGSTWSYFFEQKKQK